MCGLPHLRFSVPHQAQKMCGPVLAVGERKRVRFRRKRVFFSYVISPGAFFSGARFLVGQENLGPFRPPGAPAPPHPSQGGAPSLRLVVRGHTKVSGPWRFARATGRRAKYNPCVGTPIQEPLVTIRNSRSQPL